MSGSPNFWIERVIPISKAYLSLELPASMKVLMGFYLKRQFEKVNKNKKRSEYYLKNNKELVFTYVEAKEKYRLSEGVFKRALRELHEKGFLDIARHGDGIHRIVNLYALSDRWRKYGTHEYDKGEAWPERSFNAGFRKGNTLGQYSRKKITVTDKHEKSKVIVTHEHEAPKEQANPCLPVTVEKEAKIAVK